MSSYIPIVAAALLGLFCVPSRAEEPAVTNAYCLIFKDKNGVELAEARFITPEFTSKEHGPVKVAADIRHLENKSDTESAQWLKRLLKTGKKVEIAITTRSYITGGGGVMAETHIGFSPSVVDANISALYIEHPHRKERSWSYDIFAGGFDGGKIIFVRIHMAEQDGTSNGG